jgi:hypothetical protein
VKREPLRTVSAVVSIVGALLSLAVAFGLDLTKDQQAAILGVATVVAPVVIALVVRPRVTPVPSVKAQD